MTMQFSRVNDLWLSARNGLVNQPNIPSRNGPMREVIGWSARLETVHWSWLTFPERKLSPRYAAAEYLWYMSGSDDVHRMTPYAPQYTRFAESDGSVHGAYGLRVVPLLDTAIEELRDLENSRRCVIPIFRPTDLGLQKADIPCTTSWQFLLRDDTLHMVVTMRSNDLWLGLPYDIFVNTCVLRYVAGILQVKPGSYTHHVGSLHVYSKDLEKAMMCKEDVRTFPISWPDGPIYNDEIPEMVSYEHYARSLDVNIGIGNTWCEMHKDLMRCLGYFDEKPKCEVFHANS